MLVIIHYHTQKQRKIKIEPRTKLNNTDMMLIKGILQPCQYLPARNDFATYSQLMIVLPIVNYFSEQYQLLFQKRNSGNKLAKKN